MEYVEGETLAERLQRGAIPLAQAIRFASQIADALHRAHRLGIVHRDLKPANVILTRGSVKLLDFGLAQLDVGEAADDGELIGTPQYMPPEQFERRQVDARGDIFACGAVLYEMISGRRAFTGRSQADVMAAILHEDPTPGRAASCLMRLPRSTGLYPDASRRIQKTDGKAPATSNTISIGPRSPWMSDRGALAEAATFFGPVREIVRSEIESREYVTFARQPRALTFRLDYTGIFSPGSRRTTRFAPTARILSIAISSSASRRA